MKKSDIDKLSASYARRTSASNDASTSELRSRAKNSLSSVNDVYQVASEATETLRTLLAQGADLSPKDLLQLTSALRNIGTVLAECREEARRTVSDLSTQAKELDPPAPRSDERVDTVHTTMAIFSSGENQVGYLPTSDDLAEEIRIETLKKKSL